MDIRNTLRSISIPQPLHGRCQGQSDKTVRLPVEKDRHTTGQFHHQPPLDGLRAFALLTVLAYHAGIDLLPGGFLGVEVFFVLSGYLITSILLTESNHGNGGIDLVSFWIRRARRLVPALLLTVLGVMAFSYAFLPEEIGNLGSEALSVLTYTANWHFIAKDTSYFEAFGRPSLLQHCWSLAVEGQFYLAWPFLLAVCLRAGTPRLLLALTGCAAFLSMWFFVFLYEPGTDPSRVYYGTDTRAGGLLIGALTAQIIAVRYNHDWLLRRSGVLVSALEIIAFGILLTLMLKLTDDNTMMLSHGLIGTAIATGLLIALLVREHSLLRPLFSSTLMRWIGHRSYGLYLWHWPVFSITRPDFDLPMDGLPLLTLRLAITLALASFSYRFVETPIRVHGFKWLPSGTGQQGQPVQVSRLRVATFSAAFTAITALSVAVAVAIPPPMPEELAVVQLNASAEHETTDQETPVDDVAAQPAVSWEDVQQRVASIVPSLGLPSTACQPASCIIANASQDGSPESHDDASLSTATTKPAHGQGQPRNILLLGDSVMLGATSELKAELGAEARIDAVVGRQVDKGIETLIRYRRESKLGDTVVIHLGTNGTFTADQLDKMIDVIGPQRNIFLVTAKVPRRWEASVNETIRQAPDKWSNVTVIDWHQLSNLHRDWFGSDNVHPKPIGRRFYASLVHDALFSI